MCSANNRGAVRKQFCHRKNCVHYGKCPVVFSFGLFLGNVLLSCWARRHTAVCSALAKKANYKKHRKLKKIVNLGQSPLVKIKKFDVKRGIEETACQRFKTARAHLIATSGLRLSAAKQFLLFYLLCTNSDFRRKYLNLFAGLRLCMFECSVNLV